VTPKKPKDAIDRGTEKLIHGINELVELRKASSSKLGQQEALMYYSMYVNLDRILKQLPSEVVEDLNMQFTSQCYDALRRQRDLRAQLIVMEGE